MLPSPSDRLALQRAHLALLHPRRSRGKICTARATPGIGRGWDEGLVSPSSKAISEQLASADVEYVGMNRFSGRRHSSCVTGISSAFQDLDYYKDGLPYADASVEEIASILVETYQAAGIPLMSLVVNSGRGGYPQWLFKGMDGDALPRWQAAMKNLRGPKLDANGNVPSRRPRKDKAGNTIAPQVDPKVAAFEARMLPVWRMNRDLGLDRSAIDPARVLRVMGAINPKSGHMARLAWPSSIQDIEAVDFDAWCDALMPYTRAEMRAIQAERKAWKEAHPEHVARVRRVRRPRRGGKWASILDDLMRLLEHRGAAEFERLKMRDLWALFSATAISVTEGGCARDWAERLAPMIGLPIHEVEVSLSGVERGMHAHDAGQTVDYKGGERPAFYDYSYARIVDELDIGIEEAGAAGLRVLVPGGAIPLSDAERQRACRDARTPGRVTRSGQAEERLSLGLMAYALRKGGATLDMCARVLCRSRASISQALREAEADVAVNGESLVALMFARDPSVTGDRVEIVADAQADEASVHVSAETCVQTVYEESRSIVVVDPIEAPAAPTDAIQPGEVRVTRWTSHFAEIATATGRWEWTRVDGVWGRGHHDEARLLTPSAVVSPADAALASVACQDLARAATKPAPRSSRGDRRRPSRTRPAPLKAAPLVPLDVAADRTREAALYLEASGGLSSYWDRRGLVAA